MAAPSASIAVANAIWEQIKSSRSGLSLALSAPLTLSLEPPSDPLFVLNKRTQCPTTTYPSSTSYSGRTWSARRGSSTRAASEGSPAPPAGVLFSWWLGNRRGRRSTSAFPSTTALATLSSTTSSTGCKHQIAARLAEAVGALTEVEVSDGQLALMLAKL